MLKFRILIAKIRHPFRVRKWKKHMPFMINNYILNGIQLNNVRISSSTVVSNESNLKIEKDVFIGHFNFIESSNLVQIGEGVQITNYISILTHSSHISIRLYGERYSSHIGEMKGYKKGAVKIDKYSFIGPHSTIQAGTNIGKGCIVTANSIVKGDFPDFSIISGNPAKVIGDTRDLDIKYLSQYPDLQKYYDKWAKN